MSNEKDDRAETFKYFREVKRQLMEMSPEQRKSLLARLEGTEPAAPTTLSGWTCDDCGEETTMNSHVCMGRVPKDVIRATVPGGTILIEREEMERVQGLGGEIRETFPKCLECTALRDSNSMANYCGASDCVEQCFAPKLPPGFDRSEYVTVTRSEFALLTGARERVVELQLAFDEMKDWWGSATPEQVAALERVAELDEDVSAMAETVRKERTRADRAEDDMKGYRLAYDRSSAEAHELRTALAEAEGERDEARALAILAETPVRVEKLCDHWDMSWNEAKKLGGPMAFGANDE